MQTQTPSLIAEYFGVTSADPVLIAQTFTPGKGWTNYPGRKRVSVSWLRTLRGEGVTGVSFEGSGGVRVDFTVDEILQRARRDARQPLLGGSLIGSRS